MRILLIATNRHNRVMSRMRAQPIPIGLAYVAGHLDRSRHEVKLVDLMFASDDYLNEVESTVRDFNPELVGISIRNLSNHSYIDPQWQLPITKSVIERIRSISDATIVCGGPAFSIMPTQVFDYVQPDFGLAGDAGESFADLAGRIEIGEPDYRGMTGLLHRENGELVYNGMRCSSDFIERPSLDDLDMPKYAKAGFGVSVPHQAGGLLLPDLCGRHPHARRRLAGDPPHRRGGSGSLGGHRALRIEEDFLRGQLLQRAAGACQGSLPCADGG